MTAEPPLEPRPESWGRPELHGEVPAEESSVTLSPPSSSEPPAFTEGFRLEGPGWVLAWGAAADDGAQPPLAPGTVPCLREQTAYPVLLRSTGGAPVALEHRDPLLLGALRSGDGGRVWWGMVDFVGQVGRSAFRVRAGEGEAAAFEVEVVPTKVGYRSDFAALVHDTHEITAALVLEWLRATTHPGAPVPLERPARIEWLLLLRRAADELEAALARIAREPRHALRREGEAVRAERVRRPDASLRRAVLRGAGSGGSVALGGGGAVRERVDERRPRPTADTPEHRWLAAQLRAARRGVERLLAAERKRPPSPRGGRALAEMEELAGRVARLERSGPLASVEGEPPASFASLLLLHAPGYREAHRACLLLLRGVTLGVGPADLALRDLHLLYEQWCWLALARALAAVTGSPLPARALLAEGADGLCVRLRHGWEGALVFPLANGGTATLVPQPRFGGDALLVPQRPDALLEVRRPGRAPVRAVLDAKYRVDSSPAYAARFGAAGPPEDALNTLHRYRDALGAHAAVALFPGRAEGFGATRLHAAVGTLGVGALPFLPGETAWVEAWLREMTA